MSEGPGILGIALGVALGIGIAYDDGWIGDHHADAKEPVASVSDTAAQPPSVPVALKIKAPQPK